MKSFIAILLFSAILSTVSTARSNNYCAICKEHTMCNYEGIGDACENVGEGGVTNEERKVIVRLHNSYRKKVAKGQETRGLGGGQPQAANLLKVRWDPELAKVAQRWADQCLFQHDTCRDDGRWKVGQNIYWSYKIPVSTEANWTAAVGSWYEEVADFNPQNIARYRHQSSTGHYTQVVWHNSANVGCGRRNYGPNKIYVCNYGPSGNWLGDPMYAVGPACSKCPEGTKCNDGLCERVRNANGKLPQKDGTTFKRGNDETANQLNQVNDGTNSEETPTTELPIELNVIDDLEFINSDEEIKKELEDLKIRINQLTRKIIEKKKLKNEIVNG